MAICYFPSLFQKRVGRTNKSLKIPKGNQNPQIEGQTIQWLKEKGQATIYKTLLRKLKIEQHEPH